MFSCWTAFDKFIQQNKIPIKNDQEQERENENMREKKNFQKIRLNLNWEGIKRRKNMETVQEINRTQMSIQNKLGKNFIDVI